MTDLVPVLKGSGPLAELDFSRQVSLGGSLVTISAGVATSVGSMEFPLEAPYTYWSLKLFDVTLATTDFLAFVFSTDGGVTWGTGSNAYQQTVIECNSQINGGSGGGASYADNVGYLVDYRIPITGTANVSLLIRPGSASRPAYISAVGDLVDFVTSTWQTQKFQNALKQNGVVNRLGVMPYGNADFPPTSGHLFSSSYIFSGVTVE